MFKLLQVAFRIRHEVHDGARVEDVLPVERPHGGPTVLPAVPARLEAELVGVQDLGSVQAIDDLVKKSNYSQCDQKQSYFFQFCSSIVSGAKKLTKN